MRVVSAPRPPPHRARVAPRRLSPASDPAPRAAEAAPARPLRPRAAGRRRRVLGPRAPGRREGAENGRVAPARVRRLGPSGSGCGGLRAPEEPKPGRSRTGGSDAAAVLSPRASPPPETRSRPRRLRADLSPQRARVPGGSPAVH